jgi:hypothetical protein
MNIKIFSFAILSALLLVPTIAFAADDNVVYGFTSGRLFSTIDAAVGLISAVIGGMSLKRSIRRIGNNGQNGAMIAGVVGLIVIAYAVIHLSIFTGNFGTGGGRAGAIIAIVMGLISMILAGITLARSRHAN